MKRSFLFLSLSLLLLMGACKPEKAPPTPEMPQEEDVVATKPTEPAAAEACTYSTDPNQIKMEWTAYKFTDKTPVKGTFTGTQVEGEVKADSLSALVQGLRMKLDGATIESGDPGRNLTVKDFFFAKFNPPFQMEAWVKDLQGTDTAGSLTLVLQMNGVSKEAPFVYTATPEGELTAKGGINLMNWNLQPAFDSIHQACETMHTGKDGVSKTWEVVDLKIVGKFSKDCSS